MPQRWEDMTPAQRKRNGRIVAIALAFSTIISLAFLAFAFVTKAKAERAAVEYEVKVHGLEAQLNSCVQEAAMARAQAEQAMAEAVRQRELAEQRK